MRVCGHRNMHSRLSHSRRFWHTACARRMLRGGSTGPTQGGAATRREGGGRGDVPPRCADPVRGARARRRLVGGQRACRSGGRVRNRGAAQLLPRLPPVPGHMSSQTPTIQKLALHNLDAMLAILALPVFALTGLPLEGWFWAVAIWAGNRVVQVMVERRAVQMGALRAVGVLGASMLLRPWIGMLLLFLITRHDSTLAISSVVLFMVLVTVDIATRILTHRNIRTHAGRTA